MKKMLVLAMLVAFAASPSFAADAPETVTLLGPTKGNVTFNHKAHAGKMECKVCHGEGTPAKVVLGGMAKGHALCKDCHTKGAAGPTKCGECHKK